MAPRSCIYCGSRPVTREHVLPQWLRDEIGPVESTETHWRRVGAPDEETFGFASGAVEWVVRALCAGCNSWSGNTFEDTAKPILRPLLRDENVTLAPTDLARIAAWVAKTAIAAEARLGVEGLRIPQADRDHIRSTDTAPPNARVWVGRHNRAPEALTFFFLNPLEVVDNSGSGRPPGTGYCATFVFLELILQLVAHDLPVGEVVSEDGLRYRNQLTLIRPWETTESLEWPARTPKLHSSHIWRLATRFAPDSPRPQRPTA
jgi:hypothetical protein